MAENVIAKRYPDIESVKSSGEPGAYTINDVADQSYKNLWFNSPADASDLRRIPIGGSAKSTDGEKPWGWDGDEDKPTLNPSVFLDPQLPGWHGWLRDGVWVSV